VLDRFSELAGGLDHPEGVAWDPGGSVVAGGEAGQVVRVVLDGSVAQVGSTGGFLFGVTVSGSGEVFACDFGKAELSRMTPDGEVTTWSTGTPERPMQVPNFSAFDEVGNLYVTDSGVWGTDTGVVFRVDPSGTTTIWSDAVPAFPNGCCLSADGGELLVVESRARRVAAVPIGDDGAAGPPRPLVDLTGTQPDGVTLADDGTMFVGCYRPDRIWMVRPDGDRSVLAEDADGVVLNQPANVAFFGPELDRIVVSSLGGWSLMWTDVGLRGLPLRYPTV